MTTHFSRNNYPLDYAVIAVCASILILNGVPSDSGAIPVVLGFLAVIAFKIAKIKHILMITFDDEYVYITNYNSDFYYKVPFTDILKVKGTGLQVGLAEVHRIEFVVEGDKKKGYFKCFIPSLGPFAEQMEKRGKKVDFSFEL